MDDDDSREAADRVQGRNGAKRVGSSTPCIADDCCFWKRNHQNMSVDVKDDAIVLVKTYLLDSIRNTVLV
jgi:hypothetical protein